MAEVARNHSSLPFGYDEAFLNPVDEDFLCPICQLPAKEPVQTSCGHRFCQDCIKEYLQRNERQGQYCTCPVDRETVLHMEKIFPDVATKRKILSLRIQCRNEDCPWTDELRERENHLNSCEFQVVRCTHENCQAMVKRKDLEAHRVRDCRRRITNCLYCQEPYAVCMEEDHYSNCRRIPIPCECGAIVSREMIPDHIEQHCKKALIPCPYNEIGCTEKVLRGDLELHLKSATAQHVNLLKKKLTKTTADQNGLQEEVNDLKKKNEERCEALQKMVNAVEGKLEKEIQIFNAESQNLHAAFEEIKTDLRKEFEERVNAIQKEDNERCETLENEMNALRRQHDEEVRVLKEERDSKVDALQKELAACEKKIDALQNVVNTNRNERAAKEEEANNQARELEERVRNITEELDRVNWNTKANRIASAVGFGALIIFAIVRLLV